MTTQKEDPMSTDSNDLKNDPNTIAETPETASERLSETELAQTPDEPETSPDHLTEASETLITNAAVEPEQTTGDVHPGVVTPAPDFVEEGASPSASDSYFEDDEKFLGDDEILSLDDTMAIVQQTEGVVSCEIINFRNEKGEVKSKYALRSEPPILVISASDGNEAQFIVTQELARTLSNMFGDIHKGYFGVRPKKRTLEGDKDSRKTMNDKVMEMRNWAVDNPLPALGIVLLVLFVLLSPFLF